MVNPVPISVACGMGADVVIAVTARRSGQQPWTGVEAVEERGKLPSLIHSITRSVEIMQGRIGVHSSEAATVAIRTNFRSIPKVGLQSFAAGRPISRPAKPPPRPPYRRSWRCCRGCVPQSRDEPLDVLFVVVEVDRDSEVAVPLRADDPLLAQAGKQLQRLSIAERGRSRSCCDWFRAARWGAIRGCSARPGAGW